jgi:beta-lactamase regulating signal transducer with metallopeptidase domain
MVGLHALWQAELVLGAVAKTTLIVLAAVIAGLVVGRRGDLASRVWLVAVIAMCLLPVLGRVLPAVTLEFATPGFMVSFDNPVQLDGVRARVAQVIGVSESAIVQDASRPIAGARRVAGPGLAAYLLLIWTLGSFILAARMVAGLRRLGRIAAEGQPVRTGRLASVAAAESLRHGLTSAPDLRITSQFPVAVTFGWRRPVILLPADATAWTEQRARMVIGHELAHVRRRDWLRHLAARMACVVYWFHPLVWTAARRHRLAVELACDQEVVRTGHDACDYALELVRLTPTGAAGGPVAAGAMLFLRRSELECRVRALLRGERTQPSQGARARVALAVVIALLPFIAALRMVAGPCPTPGTLTEAAALVQTTPGPVHGAGPASGVGP